MTLVTIGGKRRGGVLVKLDCRADVLATVDTNHAEVVIEFEPDVLPAMAAWLADAGTCRIVTVGYRLFAPREVRGDDDDLSFATLMATRLPTDWPIEVEFDDPADATVFKTMFFDARGNGVVRLAA